jgi:hypothetical protein
MAKKGKALPDKRKKQVPEERHQLLEDTRTLLKHWTRVRDFLLMAFQNEPIPREQEQAFLQLKSETARSQRVVSSKIPEELAFGSDKITDFLRQAISISHLRSLPLADKRGLVGAWHVASVMLHRAAGALEYINETQLEIKDKKKTLRGIHTIRSEASARNKRNPLPVILGIVLNVAVAVGLFLILLALR